MQNPETQLNEYLDRVKGEVSALNANMDSLKSMVEFIQDAENKDVADAYWYLFRSLYDLLFDNVVLTLAWLFDPKGQRSLNWCLARVQEQSRALIPMLADARMSHEPRIFQTQKGLESYKLLANERPLTKKERQEFRRKTLGEFGSTISECRAGIENIQDQLEALKAVRDESIAHRGRRFFDDPKRFWDEMSLGIDDLDCLTNTAKTILKKLYGLLRDTELVFLSSEYIGLGDLGRVLKKYHRMEGELSQERSECIHRECLGEGKMRTATIDRKTGETEIHLTLALEGRGRRRSTRASASWITC